MKLPDGVRPFCTGCNKHPDELDEFIDAVEEEEYDHPDEYVEEEEGTLNPENGHFLCTPCYVKAGMPSAPGGWVAP